VLQAASFAADEKLVLALTAGLWIAARIGDRQQRQRADLLALDVIASAVLPHLLKGLVDQERPDRRVHGPRHGIPVSGKAYDAFPSGHAVHIGAVASVVTRFFPGSSRIVWSIGAALAATRVMLLAHWLTDVVAGLVVGAALERLVVSIYRPQDKA
jgi:undecaprenyl-diphosphatase